MEPKNDCPICFESLTGKIIGTPDICHHKFCLSCLEKWSKHGNICPVDRKSFKKIISGNKVIQIKLKKRKKPLELYDISVCCEICKGSKECDTVILCDSCDLAFHFDCLEPPLKYVPRGSWFCYDCKEVERKLKARKTKNKGCPDSKQRSSAFSPCLNSSTKQTDISLRKVNRVNSFIDQSTSSSNQTNIPLLKENGVNSSIDQSINIKFKTNENNRTNLFKKDYFNENRLPKTVNSSLYSTPQGEFEDFFSVCDNDDVILTNRKLLSTEEESLWHARSSSEAQQTEMTSKRLVAASERNNALSTFVKDTIGSSDNSSSSSVVYSTAEEDFPENAFLNAGNYFSYNKKFVDPHESSSFLQRNKNAQNHTFGFSSSVSKCMNELVLEDIKEKNIPMKEFNEAATSMASSNCEKLTAFSSVKPPGCVSREDSNKLKSGCLSAESFNISDEPISISARGKSLHSDNLQKEKLESKETSKINSNVFCKSLRKKLQVPQSNFKTDTLAAANARLKVPQNIKSIYFEQFSDEFSDSSNHHSVTKNDSEPTLSLKTSNHNLFKNIEQIFSDLDSSFCDEKSGAKDLNEISSSKSRSEIVTLGSDSENIKVTNITVEDLNKSVVSNSSSVQKCHRTVYVSLSDCLKEGENKIPISMGSKSSAIFEKSPIKSPPKLLPEPSNFIKKSTQEIPPEPLTICKNIGNEMPPFIKEVKTQQNTFVTEESNCNVNKSSLEIFSILEKATDASCSTEKHSNKKTEESHSLMKRCKYSENVELLLEKDNFPDGDINAGENIINDFHIRQIHYAVKAKMNLSAELRQIERETWLSRRPKSSKKYKYKSCKETEISISSSSHLITAGDTNLYQFLKNTQLDNNKSKDCKKDITEYNNIYNPFSQSVSSSCPKKLFKVTEYSLKPFDKHVCFNKIPKNVLQSFMSPNSLKHLDIRDDGSLFLNWPKTNSF